MLNLRYLRQAPADTAEPCSPEAAAAVADALAAVLPPTPVSARLAEIGSDGTLVALLGDGTQLACDWLMSSGGPAPALEIGDELLLTAVAGRTRPVVVGRIGPYVPPAAGAPAELTLEATQTLRLKCGESSLDLRADGKLMIRGDDVLVRAKGTQRIRAGTVSIN
ncbi:MAG: hypothetical protein HZC37_13425 [Burkholderiales bacterium]|nr:hypothetical protein [Burkholderiales bacterium]